MQQGVLLGVASKKTAFINERHWKRQLLLQSMPWGSMSLSVLYHLPAVLDSQLRPHSWGWEMELMWAEQHHGSGGTRLWGLFGPCFCGKSGLLHCRIPNNTRSHSLVQTVYFLWKMSFQFGTLVGRGLMDPSLFSSITQGWQLSGSFTDPLYFSPPPRQVKAWSLAKDLYPEWCLNHLPMGKRWPKR